MPPLKRCPRSLVSEGPDGEPIEDRGRYVELLRREADGVYVFGGGINDAVAPVGVAAHGAVTNGTYPQTREFGYDPEG